MLLPTTTLIPFLMFRKAKLSMNAMRWNGGNSNDGEEEKIKARLSIDIYHEGVEMAAIGTRCTRELRQGVGQLNRRLKGDVWVLGSINVCKKLRLEEL
jgi:hypothetical protein